MPALRTLRRKRLITAKAAARAAWDERDLIVAAIERYAERSSFRVSALAAEGGPASQQPTPEVTKPRCVSGVSVIAAEGLEPPTRGL
jgi:hypothetical protein